MIATLRRVEGIEAIYQLHKNVTATDAENTDAAFIANTDEQNCQGEGIALSTSADGKTQAADGSSSSGKSAGNSDLDKKDDKGKGGGDKGDG